MGHTARRFRRHAILVRLLIVAFVVSAGIPLVDTMTSSTSAQGTSEKDEALALVNMYRARIGAPPIQRHSALENAAQGHANYYEMNYGDPSLAGMGLHQQSSSNPGFTGATIGDRARNAGYNGSYNENIGLSGSLLYSTQWFIDTINHRLPLLDPRYTDIGFGSVNNGDAKIEVIMVGSQNWSNTGGMEWMPFPADGSTNVGLSFHGEAPNPYPGASYPVGYPITLKYYGSQSIQFNSARLEANGRNIQLFAQTGTGWLTERTFMISAIEPLQTNTVYTVTVDATVGGSHVQHRWSFETGSGNGGQHGVGASHVQRSHPPGVEQLDPVYQNTWWEADGPVHQNMIERSWLWGPDTFAQRNEAYAESPGGARSVVYFDKTRMEINDPNANPDDKWYVTNGLLVRDMIRGSIQVGDHNHDHTASPANIQLAGDSLQYNAGTPTYASLQHIAAVADGRRSENRTGGAINSVLHADGSIGETSHVNGLASYGHYDETTGQNVADVFWNWLQNEGYNWLYVTGHPLADPYWVRTKVNGDEQWVLVQAFQRRVLTYTPNNDPDWQLEMGNVGRHYYAWRYGDVPALP